MLNSLTRFLLRGDSPGVIMHKLLFITLLITVHALGSESFTLSQVADEEEKGTVDTVIDTLKSYYDNSMDTVNGYMENIMNLNLEEKAVNLFQETTTAVRTYAGIFQDQLYHMVYPQDS